MKNFNQKLLSASVSMLMTVSICHVATTQASDIEIYKLPDQSKMTLFLMFDTSGSMGVGYNYNNNTDRNAYNSIYQDYNLCKWSSSSNSSIKSESKTYKIGTRSSKTYNVNYCEMSNTVYSGLNATDKKRIQSECVLNGTVYRCYDRLSRLKMALSKALSGTEIDSSINIGLGQFSSQESTSAYSQDGFSGRILYPVVPLTEENREKLIDKMVALDAYNGTPSAAAYGESGAYFLGKNTYGLNNSGYSYSILESKTGTGTTRNNGYAAPVTSTELANTCNGQGIYFLTDGVANNSDQTKTRAIMSKSFSISSWSGMSGGANNAGWTEIGQFAKSLRNTNIKTAVAGFGSDFPKGSTYEKILPVDILDQAGDVVETVNRPFYDCSQLPTSTANEQSVKNTCNWGAKTHTQLPNVGGFGNGGFYSVQSDVEIVNSIKYFIEDIKPRFKPIATGSPTSPVDALNPIQLQPYGYYASFTPKPQENYQLWLGNLNKYHVYKGELYNSSKTIKLIQSSGELNSGAYGIWGTNGGGVLEKLPLGTWTNPANATQKSSNRKVFTNRQINTSNQAEEATSLQSVNLTTLFASGTDGKFVNDPKKNYWLNILGYKVAENATGLTINTLPTEEQRQLGAVMHSKPILLTQEGKIVVTKDTSTPPKPVVTTTARQDYLLFGTNQGMLHVVKVGTDTDTDRGEEVFTFVPHEMMEKQYKGFLSEGNTNLGRDNLYYGIDGAWTAYSQYVSKTGSASTLTVKGKNDDGDDLSNQAGLQLVYGGLRMGGRGYYGLDLRTITSPTLKFHINPDAAAANTPLSYMGQSWSKPTIAWVNWGGAPKLVMFVGGGYDAGGVNGNGLDASGNRVTNGGYENPAYEQTNKKGAGVYMFDADDGSLLWWSSANVGTSTATTTDSGTIATNDDNLKYSVVSQINAVDRDGDGLVDHLYFGDLGGQAFRIDLNNKASTLGAFAKRVVRLYNAHVTTGASPRFYEMPSFSVHTGVDGYFGAVALSSGNRSSPLAGTNTVGGSVVTTITANDGVYVIYDNDVTRKDLYDDITLITSPTGAGVTLTDASAFATLKAGIAQKTGANYNGGWKYQFHTTAGKYKGMNELYALDNMLYVNVYHKDGTGISGACGSGVKGDTELYQFCLPTGKCPFEYPTTATDPNKIVLGGGILGTGLGVGYSNKLDEMSIIKGKEGSDCTDTANKNKPECQLFDTGSRLQHLRWYESR